MSAPPLPINNSSADQLEILQKIESLGGSAGYDLNPDAFTDLVPALDTFKPDVWTKAIKELAEHEKDPGARALKAKLQAELDLQHSDPKLAQKQRITGIIKGAESLGGSIGFKTFTENPQPTLPAADRDLRKSAATNSSSTYAWGFVASAGFVTALNLQVEGHQGGGHAWGVALGVGNLQGILEYESFDADSFVFANSMTPNVATALFTSNGSITSQFTGALIGVSVAFSFGGDWKW